jgi:hypothetical protein
MLRSERGNLAIRTHVPAVQRSARRLRKSHGQCAEVEDARRMPLGRAESRELVHQADDASVPRCREPVLGHLSDLSLDERATEPMLAEHVLEARLRTVR